MTSAVLKVLFYFNSVLELLLETQQEQFSRFFFSPGGVCTAIHVTVGQSLISAPGFCYQLNSKGLLWNKGDIRAAS